MTTLAEITLQVAKRVMDVTEGTATSGSATSLIDTINLTQNGDYWINGTLWLLSGTHSGKTVVVRSYASNKVTFDSLTTTVGTPLYAIAKATYPYHILKSSVNSAIDEVTVTKVDDSITATTAKEYTIPSSVGKIFRVETENDGIIKNSTHWQERDGKIIFSKAPTGTIRLIYAGNANNLSTYSDIVNTEINLEWLRWAATIHCLRWGLRTYQADPSLRVEELLNEAYRKVESVKAKNVTNIRLKTASLS